MKIINLTLQDAGNGRKRFGISAKDSFEIFKGRDVKVTIKINGNSFETKTSCGIPFENGKPLKINRNGNEFRKKGYDLYSAEIDLFLKKNEKMFKLNGKSKFLPFILEIKNEIFILNHKV